MTNKTVSTTLHFATDDETISVDITDQVVFRIVSGPGVQAVNFPAMMLPAVKGLLELVADDQDVVSLLEALAVEPVPEEPVE